MGGNSGIGSLRRLFTRLGSPASSWERGISESFGRRAKTHGSKDQRLRSFRAPKPVVVAPVVRRWAAVPIRGMEGLRPAVPRAALQHFEVPSFRSLRVLRRTVLVIDVVLPAADPSPGIPGHIIDARGTLTIFQCSHRYQRRMLVPVLFPIVRP